MAAATDSPLSATQLAELRAALESRRGELRRIVDARGRPVEDEEQLVEDVDLATREIVTAETETLNGRDRALLAEVEAALARMDAGTYGVSQDSGEPIPFARLRAIPWARQGAEEAEEIEDSRRRT